MKKIVLLIVIFFLSYALAFGKNFDRFNQERSVRFYITSGIFYNFNLSEDILTQNDKFFFEIPLRLNFDFRVLTWLSLVTGVDLLYNYHLYYYSHRDINKHNFFIRIPLTMRFYFLSLRHARYRNMYIGLGTLVHFWPINYYLVYDKKQTFAGHAYQAGPDFIYPAAVYPPVNTGVTLSFGNSFNISERVLFGLELCTQFLAIPFHNGYFTQPEFTVNNHLLLNFMLNIGLNFSFGFELWKNY